MRTVTYEPKPMRVDEDALKGLERYAAAKGVAAEDVIAAIINTFETPADGNGRPVIHTGTAYRPKRSPAGRIILPAEWDDPEDAIYDNA